MTCNEAMDREISYGDPHAERRVSRREYTAARVHINQCDRCQQRESQSIHAGPFGWEGLPEQQTAISRERVERLLEHLPALARSRILTSYNRMGDAARYQFVRQTLDELPVLDGALDDAQIVDLVAIADDVAETDAVRRRTRGMLTAHCRPARSPILHDPHDRPLPHGMGGFS